MPVTDPIADLLVRIKNAISARKVTVDVPSSVMKREICRILLENKYIDNFNVIDDNKQGTLKIKLKYINSISSITDLKRISTPGLRKYTPADKIIPVFNGLGISIISTSKGLKTDYQARSEKIGGEVICNVW